MQPRRSQCFKPLRSGKCKRLVTSSDTTRTPTLGIACKGGKKQLLKIVDLLFPFWSFGSDACPGIRDLGGGPGSTRNPFPRRPRRQPLSIRHTCPYSDPQGIGAGGVCVRRARASGVLGHALRSTLGMLMCRRTAVGAPAVGVRG